MLRDRKVFTSAVLMLGLGVFAAESQATPIVNQSPYQTTAFTVSSTDLIEGLLPTRSGGIQNVEVCCSSSNGAALTDGTFGPANPNPSGGTSITIINTNAYLVYELPFGTNLTEVDTYSAWQDGGRSQQNYNFYVSNNGVNFTEYTSVNAVQDPYGGPYPPENSPSDDKVVITDTTGTIATDVHFVAFSFPTVENGHIGYAELDVFGTRIPEPASFALFGLGAIGLLLAARRRRAA